jgi:hypothetical protein
MNKHRVAVVLFVLALAQSAAAQTADEVIEKSIAAMGGRAAMEKIKSRQMTGTLTLQTPAGDIPGTIEVLNAVPNKARTVIKADLSSFGAGALVVDQRFDGTAGYVLDTLQGNREITGSQLEGMKANSFPHPFLNYKALGMTATVSGKGKVGDREAIILTMQPTTGTPVKQYVDAETFMPLRTVITASIPQVGDVEQNADPSDFRVLDGVKVPYKVSISSSVQGLTMAFSKVEHNVPVDEKLFVKP